MFGLYLGNLPGGEQELESLMPEAADGHESSVTLPFSAHKTTVYGSVGWGVDSSWVHQSNQQLTPSEPSAESSQASSRHQPEPARRDQEAYRRRPLPPAVRGRRRFHCRDLLPAQATPPGWPS